MAIPPASSGGPPSRPSVFDIQDFARKYIPFATRFLSGQKSGVGQYVSCVFGVANTPVAFKIALGKIPSRYVVVGQTVGGSVFASAANQAAWTANSITFQASQAGTYAVWVA